MTIQDIASIYFVPELISNYQSRPNESKGVADLTKNNSNSNPEPLMVTISDQASSTKAQANSPLSGRKQQSKEFSRSLKGLANPLMTKLGRHTASGPMKDSPPIPSPPRSSNFELYVKTDPVNTNVKMNCPLKLSSAILTHSIDPLQADQPKEAQRAKFTPNIYNKIEISYITNNYSPITTSETGRGGSENFSSSGQMLQPQEQNNSLNESYTLELGKYREVRQAMRETDLTPLMGSPLDGEYKLNGTFSSTQALQNSDTDIRKMQSEIISRSERPSMYIEERSPKIYHFKEDPQYRSLHELASPREVAAEDEKLIPTSFLKDFNQHQHSKENVKSQLLPLGENLKKSFNLDKEAESKAFKKKGFMTRLDKITKKIGIDLHKMPKPSIRKSKPTMDTVSASTKLIKSDSKTRITRKINNIFKTAGKNTSGEIKSGKGVATKTSHNVSSTSLGKDIRKTVQATPSVHELMKKFGTKKSLRSSLLATPNLPDPNWNKLRTDRGKRTSLTKIKRTSLSVLESAKYNRTDVSIYKAKDGLAQEESSTKDEGSYNLIYRSDKGARLIEKDKLELNSQDKIFKSTYDAKLKMYVRQCPTFLNLLSKKTPSVLISQLEEVILQLWPSKEVFLSRDECYSISVKLGKNSFSLRIEAIEDLEAIYTIALYPKSVPARAAYLKQVSELFSHLDA